jgi:proteasome lid subunit RPN8/RPN11
MEQDILRYLSDLYPEEGCGIILNRKGTLEWHPCDNIAEDKFNNFKIAAKDFVSLGLQGDIEAIVHSHPDSTCEASLADKKASDHLRIPYHIYSLPEIEKSVYLPVDHKRPLAGRVYDFKTANCYTLIRD